MVNVACIAQLEARLEASNAVLQSNAVELKESEEYIRGLESQLGKQEELAAIVTLLETEILKGHRREVDQRSVSETIVQRFKVSFETRINVIISSGNGMHADVLDGLRELHEEVGMMDDIIAPIEEEELSRSLSIEGGVISNSPDGEGDVLDLVKMDEIEDLNAVISSLKEQIGYIPVTSSVCTNTEESVVPALESALVEAESRTSDLETKVVELEAVIDASKLNSKKIEDKLDGFNNERNELFIKLSTLQLQAESHLVESTEREIQIGMLKRTINEKDLSLCELMNSNHGVRDARSFSSLADTEYSECGVGCDVEMCDVQTLTDVRCVDASSGSDDEYVVRVDSRSGTDIVFVDAQTESHLVCVDSMNDPHVESVVFVNAESNTYVVEKGSVDAMSGTDIVFVDAQTEPYLVCVDSMNDPHVESIVFVNAESNTEVVDMSSVDAGTSTMIESVDVGVATEDVVTIDAGTLVVALTSDVETVTDDLLSLVEVGINTEGVSLVVESSTNTEAISSVVENSSNTEPHLSSECSTNTEEAHSDRSIDSEKEKEEDLLERITLLNESFKGERSVYTTEMEFLSVKIKSLEDVNRELKSSIPKPREIANDESLVADLSNRIVSIQSRNKELESYNSDLKGKLVTIQAESRSRPQLNESILSMWKKLAASEKIQKEQQNLISRLEQQLSDQDSNLNESKRMVEKAEGYRERVSDLEGEVSRVRKHLSESNKANEAIEIHGERFAFLNRRIKQLEGCEKGKDTPEVTTDMVSERDTLSTGVKELSLRIVSIEQERDGLLSSLRNARSTSEAYRVSSEIEVSGLKSDVKSRTDEIDAIKSKLDTVYLEIAYKKEAVKEQTSIVSKLKIQIDEQDSAFVKVLNENMQHVEQISLLESRVNESTTASRSISADEDSSRGIYFVINI